MCVCACVCMCVYILNIDIKMKIKKVDPAKKVYGFIAEEVKHIMKEAIDDTTEQLIPNIYKLGNVENDILTI